MNLLDSMFGDNPRPKIIAFVAGAIATLLIGHLFRRFQNRMLALRFKASHTRLGQSSDDIWGGKLQVLYKGEEVKGLYITEASIRNDSVIDLENITLTLQYSNGEQFYGGTGEVEGHPNPIPFSPDFQKRVDKYLASDDPAKSPDREYLQRTREFTASVLNRGGKINFRFLTHSEKFPYIKVSCLHKGVKIIEEKEAQHIWTVPVFTAAFVGLMACALGLFIYYPSFESLGTATAWGFGMGSIASIVGAVCVLTFRYFIKLLR